MRTLRWMLGLSLASTACAAIGYDFGDYQQASSSGGASTMANPSPVGSDSGAAGEGPSPNTSTGNGGFGGARDGCEARSEGGAAEAPSSPDGCVPRDCVEQALECGAADDGCGAPLDCGGCFWWFLECRHNVCEFTE